MNNCDELLKSFNEFYDAFIDLLEKYCNELKECFEYALVYSCDSKDRSVKECQKN